MKQYYIDTFLRNRPSNGIDSPHSRLLSALKLNDELAEYFKDRAQIEDTYAKSILKLTKKSYISNKQALGTFLPLWEMLERELSHRASISNDYALNILKKVEQLLRLSIVEDPNYADVHRMEETIKKLARDYDEIDNKIEKFKKSAKNEAKMTEYTKLLNQKLTEWNQYAPEYLQKLQTVEQNRLEMLKNAAREFEKLQRMHAEQLIELTGNVTTTTASLIVEDEIKYFCSAHIVVETVNTVSKPSLAENSETVPATTAAITAAEPEPSLLTNKHHAVPEPSISNKSNPAPSINKKQKGRFFTKLSIRRKPKSNTEKKNSQYREQLSVPTEATTTVQEEGGIAMRQRSGSNATTSFIMEPSSSSSFRSVHAPAAAGEGNPDSPIALNNEVHQQLNKSASMGDLHNKKINNSFVSNSLNGIGSSSTKAPKCVNGSELISATQPVKIHLFIENKPLISIDDEGYSIPPPNYTAWSGTNSSDTHTLSDSLLDVEDAGSDAGSLLSNNPRLRVDIKSEVIKEEDASKSAVALSRVSTLLKEKNSASPRRLRGRREVRTTQLYSVIEQQVPDLPNSNGSSKNVVVASTLTANNMSNSSLVGTPVSGETSENTPNDLSNPFETTLSFAAKCEQQQPSEKRENKMPSIQFHVNETIQGHLKSGQVQYSVATGTISVQYSGYDSSGAVEGPAAIIDRDTHFTICSKSPLDSIEAINTELVSYVDMSNSKNTENDSYYYSFEINTQKLKELAQALAAKNSDNPPSTINCIRYKKQLDSLPLIVKPVWKCDSEKSRLLIKYFKNPHLPQRQGKKVTFENVIFVTTVTGQPQNAMSIPSGELIVQQQHSQSRMRWVIDNMNNNNGHNGDNDSMNTAVEEKESIIKAQFMTLEQGSSQPIAVRFKMVDQLLTDLSIKYTNDNNTTTKDLIITKMVKSGEYVADV
ncbi:hypothetical protein BDF20DRAFT_834847 [Mycotypha africana]|uniref:uncharacterized protein n=1 Tax=Mycotypha africana TaxID=64632 RepID=UPI0023014178|nr:uncharacterized protein BDF20DRAFT_834847 [Mycotypha africana]KAI8982201.1 hypothetical protein BDF20DRAFT_834847 [Mycotypha africana]